VQLPFDWYCQLSATLLALTGVFNNDVENLQTASLAVFCGEQYELVKAATPGAESRKMKRMATRPERVGANVRSMVASAVVVRASPAGQSGGWRGVCLCVDPGERSGGSVGVLASSEWGCWWWSRRGQRLRIASKRLRRCQWMVQSPRRGELDCGGVFLRLCSSVVTGMRDDAWAWWSAAIEQYLRGERGPWTVRWWLASLPVQKSPDGEVVEQKTGLCRRKRAWARCC
jgi:hypothetical protein